MNIFTTFTNYQLTVGQEELLKLLDSFLESEDYCFLLKGYAGTGKTFMMKGLTDYLKEINRPFIVAAPTGRAAKVISQRIKSTAYTIHKTIYSNKDIKEFKTDNTDGTETFKFYYDLKNNEEPANTIYIIDEASMLSDVYSEGEFFRFGSGFLLKDLLKYINFDNNDHKKKIIFIGDNAQLPPVNMNLSPALDTDYLLQNCKISALSYELTEVKRQQKDSGILHNATKIRKSLKENIFNQIDIETSFPDIKVVQHQDLLKTYLNACDNKLDEETIIIAYSNASVKEYNDFVRDYFFPKQYSITQNDRVILVSNNYNYEIELLNGDFGVVKDVILQNETRTITLKRKNRAGELIEIQVPLTFRDVVIQFRDSKQQLFDIPCKIIENLLHSKERDLSSDELKALYIDFKIRNPNLKAGTKELKDALRSDKYFNSLRIKFGYAVTCHKAQGGEWKRAFINCKTAMGYFNASYFRWLYTALTRAKEVLYTIDEPHFHVGGVMKPPTKVFIELKDDLIVLKHEVLTADLNFNFTEEQAHLKNICYAVFDLIKEYEMSISKIEHYSFHEIYHFLRGNEMIRVRINYNGTNRITVIKAVETNDFAKNTEILLKSIEGKMIVSDMIENEDVMPQMITFEFPHSFMQEFYEFVYSKVSRDNIKIVEIDKSKEWFHRYYFTKGASTAVINFYYNKKNQFRNNISQPTLGNSSELLTQILNLIFS